MQILSVIVSFTAGSNGLAPWGSGLLVGANGTGNKAGGYENSTLGVNPFRQRGSTDDPKIRQVGWDKYDMGLCNSLRCRFV
jgi:hypothetical protein